MEATQARRVKLSVQPLHGAVVRSPWGADNSFSPFCIETSNVLTHASEVFFNRGPKSLQNGRDGTISRSL